MAWVATSWEPLGPAIAVRLYNSQRIQEQVYSVLQMLQYSMIFLYCKVIILTYIPCIQTQQHQTYLEVAELGINESESNM